MARSTTANGGTTYFDLVIQLVTAAEASYTLRAVIYLRSLNVSDVSNNLAVGSGGAGTWSRSGALALSGVYPADANGLGVPVWSQDIVVSRVYGAPVDVAVSAVWSGVEYWGVTLEAPVPGGYIGYTVPARPYVAPAAPTGVTATRVSDAAHTVAWTRTDPSSTSAPYQSQAVQRQTDGGSWATITSGLAASATSYSDTTTSANHSYAYRVVASNSGGSATSAASSTLYTTPAAPGTPTATKVGANIALAFANAAALFETGTKVYRSDNGGAFALIDTVATPDLTAYTDTAPNPAQTHAYRVANYVGSLESAQSASSETVQLLAAPNAPTNLGPATAQDPASAITRTWTHNPVDSSAQTKYQTRRRYVGDTLWTTGSEVTSSTSADVLAGGTLTAGVVEWQVRTWGSHADPSPWSATALLTVSTRPTATIGDVGTDGVVDTSSLVVPWGYFDAESSAQTGWEVALYSGATLVELVSGVNAAVSAALATTLPNGSSWTVRVRVRDGVGLWSEWDEAAFTVSYAKPPVPTAVLSWDAHEGTVSIAVTNPPVAGYGFGFGEGGFGEGGFGGITDGEPGVATDHVDIWRSIDGGPAVLIAQGVPPNTIVTDWAPTVAGVNTYRVDAVSALPSVSTVEASVTASGAAAVFISGGPGFSQVCRAMSNVEITDVDGPERALHTFAGRTRPVEFVGTALTRTLAVEFDVLKVHVDEGHGDASAEQWRALGNLPGPHLWRDPDGRYLTVSLGRPTITRGRGGAVHHVSLAATQTGA